MPFERSDDWIEAPCVYVQLSAGNKEGTSRMQRVQSREINVSTIHDVDRAGLWQQQIEGVYVMQFAVGNVNETGNATSQIEQGVHLHGSLVCGSAPRETPTDTDRWSWNP